MEKISTYKKFLLKDELARYSAATFIASTLAGALFTIFYSRG